MPHRPSTRGMVAAVLAVAAIACSAVATAQTRRPRPLENIKILKGWDADQVRAEMRLMTAALGITCEHCHVQGNFASDEKRTKTTARRMIEMTMGLNSEYFTTAAPAEAAAGAPAEASKLGRVTCYTCHQGAAVPKTSSGYGALEW